MKKKMEELDANEEKLILYYELFENETRKFQKSEAECIEKEKVVKLLV